MKNTSKLLILTISLFTLFSLTTASQADHHQKEKDHSTHEKHDAHADHQKLKAPNGGRLIEIKNHHLVEFLADKNNQPVIRFFDQKLTPIPHPKAQIQIVAQAPSGTKKIDLLLTETENTYTAKETLPGDNLFPITLRIKTSPDASYQNLRFTYNASTCGECKLAEYACTCEGHNH